MKEIYCPQTYRINKEYPIYFGKGIIASLPEKLSSFKPNKVVLITDTNGGKLYAKKILSLLQSQYLTILLEIPAGEEFKIVETYVNLCNNMINAGVTKKSFVLILGGGVVGNLAGFAASTVMRGLNFAHVPTTIMAQADSTTGGKQAVNLPQGKNLLGCFNDPQFIIADTDFLATLPLREIRCGLAECIKHALCQSSSFLADLLSRLNSECSYTAEDYLFIISETISLKIRVLRLDPKEINEGKVLVYGHTIGHALETLSKGKLNHGEAISIGMVVAAKASLLLGLADQSLVNLHETLLGKVGLPLTIPSEISVEQIIGQLNYDKKISPALELVLLEDVGKVHHIEGRIGYPADKETLRKILECCY